MFGQKSSETGAPVSDRDKLEERLSADMQIRYEYDSQGRKSDTYNERHIATGAELRDSQGKLLGHIVRTFDANGLVIAEQQIADAPDLMVPEELRTNLNPDQVKAVGAFMAGGMMNRSV